MSSFSEMWDSTPAASSRKDREMSDVPDGEYTGRIVDFSCFQAKSNDWMIAWWIEIDQGLNRGALLQRFMGVNDRTVPYIKSDFQTVVGRIPDWSDMANEASGQTGPIRGEVIGSRVRTRQRSRRVGDTTYKDVFINELLGGPPTAPYEADRQPAQPEAEEDLPEARWEQERAAKAAEDATVKAAQEDAEGWGDPECPTCEGAGCAECVSF